MANYAFTTGRPLPEAQNGEVFESINFTQMLPHTKIFEGVQGLIFRKCNLINCDVPIGAVVESCLVAHIDFCTNVNPKFIDKGYPACSENCSHVTGTDEVRIDGVLVETIY